MNIIRHQILSEIETLDRLRNTPLRGVEGEPKVFIYRHADLRIFQSMPAHLITPPQRYVLRGTVNTILELYKTFEKRGVDIFGLTGALLFWLEGMDPTKDNPIPFLPPIVEDSEERGGVRANILCDGMHREYAAMEVGRKPNVIYIDNLPPGYPYYAYGFLGGWQNVQVFDELPDEFQKKDYRNPQNYKTLFRQLNVAFPGIQEARKQSNPSHIKA